MGEERAVPATKTVTGAVRRVRALGVGARTRAVFTCALAGVPGWVQAVLGRRPGAPRPRRRLEGARGWSSSRAAILFAAALEAALKIKETCALLADGYSAADLRHGPIAAVTAGFPVVSLRAAGPAFEDMCSLAVELREREASTRGRHRQCG